MACRFCDIDFRGTDGFLRGRFDSPSALAEHIRTTRAAEARGSRPYVVFTGGEPLLQLDGPLVAACKALGFEVAIETNGTRPAPAGGDGACVIPKPCSNLVVRMGNELKLVFPQPDLSREDSESLRFEHFLLQPTDGPEREGNTTRAVTWCRSNPSWRLSLQTHKFLGIL